MNNAAAAGTADLEVANTILQQLGGQRFIAMTGARAFVGGDDFLSFSLPAKGLDGGNKVRVTLTPMDVYTVETFYVRGTKFQACSTEEDVYCDTLRAVFERLTGLRSSL